MIENRLDCGNDFETTFSRYWVDFGSKNLSKMRGLRVTFFYYVPNRCPLCDRTFQSWQALASHVAQTHKVRSPLQCRVLNNKCPCCDKQWPYTYNNLVHIRNTRACREYVLNLPSYDYETIKPLINSDNARIKANKASGYPALYCHNK